MVSVNRIVVRVVQQTVDEGLSSDPVLGQEHDVHIQAARTSRIKLAAIAYIYIYIYICLSTKWLILLKFPA